MQTATSKDKALAPSVLTLTYSVGYGRMRTLHVPLKRVNFLAAFLFLCVAWTWVSLTWLAWLAFAGAINDSVTVAVADSGVSAVAVATSTTSAELPVIAVPAEPAARIAVAQPEAAPADMSPAAAVQDVPVAQVAAAVAEPVPEEAAISPPPPAVAASEASPDAWAPVVDPGIDLREVIHSSGKSGLTVTFAIANTGVTPANGQYLGFATYRFATGDELVVAAASNPETESEADRNFEGAPTFRARLKSQKKLVFQKPDGTGIFTGYRIDVRSEGSGAVLTESFTLQ